MARPKLPLDNLRSVKLTLRLTKEEQNLLTKLGNFCGKPAGALIRENFFKSKFPQPKMAKIDMDTYLELKKIGVNLNQLAKKANAGILPAGMLSIINKLLNQQEIIFELLFHDSRSADR